MYAKLNYLSLLVVYRAVVGFWKVVWPLNAVDVHRVPKARVVGEYERGYILLSLGGLGISPMKILLLKMTKEAILLHFETISLVKPSIFYRNCSHISNAYHKHFRLHLLPLPQPPKYRVSSKLTDFSKSIS